MVFKKGHPQFGFGKGDKHSKENNGNWLGGISFEPYHHSFDKKLKLKILVRDNYKCQKCNKKLKRNFNYTCHHIDYNKQNCNEDNLTATCRSCNVQVNKNRNFWRDFFYEKVNS